MRNNNTVNAIDDLNRPKTCAVGCIEIPNAKEAEPRTFGHNHNQTSVAEIDLALRKASKRELHKEPTAVNRGPAKIVSNDSKPLYCVGGGDPLIIDNDDTYINKPNAQEMELEDLTTEPEEALEALTPLDTGNASAPQHYDIQKDSEQVLQEGTEATIEVSQFDNTKQRANSNILHGKTGLVPLEPSLPSPTTHDGNNKSEAKEEDLTSHKNQFTQTTVEEHQPTSNQENPEKRQDPANSTFSINLGFPIWCNLWSRETPGKNCFHYCSTDRDIRRPSLKQHAVRISAKPDSLHQNHEELESGVVVASDDENHTILEQPTILGWSTMNINETEDLKLMRDVPETRYLVRSDSKTEEGISTTTTTHDHDGGNKSEANEEDLTSHQNQLSQATVGGYQPTSKQENPDNHQEPANSMLPYKGPAKVISKASKSLYRVVGEDPLTIDMDKILITNAQETEPEDLVYTPNDQQPLAHPAEPDRHGGARKKETTKPEEALEVLTSLDTGNASAPNTTTLR